MADKHKILIVEDDKYIINFISMSLKKEDYDYVIAKTCGEANALFYANRPDMIILDLGLPDGDGIEIIKNVREISKIPIIVVSARQEEEEKIQALDLGADDYITKPFSLMALVSKVNALMRRLSKVQAQIMSSGEITVHMKTMQVYKGDEPVTLSKKEFSLLLYLWENAGQIVSKESILEHVWDIDGQFVDDNTVTVNISRLKNKLGTEEIANVRGLGYIWTGKVNKN